MAKMTFTAKARTSTVRTIIWVVGLILSLAYVMPFVLVLVNSFKPKMEILDNPMSLPIEFTWDNFQQAFEKMKFFQSLTNSIIITTVSVGALILISSMLAFYLSRTKNKFTKVTFLILVSSMIVPFQALMIPFMSIFAPFVSLNNQVALIFFYMGFEHSIVNMFLFPSGLMLGGDFTIMDYLIWNEIPTVIGNLVGGLTFVGATLYSTHYKTAPKRVSVR